MKIVSSQSTHATRKRVEARVVDRHVASSRPGKRQKRSEINWSLLREEWLNQNVAERPTPYTLAELARAHGIPHQTIRVRAMRERWQRLLSERRKARGAQIRGMLEPSDIFSEVSVRVRQATYARRVQEIAMRRLQALSEAGWQEIAPSTVVELLRLGLTEERKAVALPDRFRYDPAGGERDLTPADLRRLIQNFVEVTRAQQSRRDEGDGQ